MIPVSIEGQFGTEDGLAAGADELLDDIERALADAHATSVERRGNTVTFRASMFRAVPNWNVLVGIGSGRLEVGEAGDTRVSYSFSFTQTLLVLTIAIGAVAALGVFWAGMSPRILLFVPIAWLAAVLAVYFMADARLGEFVRQTIGLNR